MNIPRTHRVLQYGRSLSLRVCILAAPSLLRGLCIRYETSIPFAVIKLCGPYEVQLVPLRLEVPRNVSITPASPLPRYRHVHIIRIAIIFAVPFPLLALLQPEERIDSLRRIPYLIAQDIERISQSPLPGTTTAGTRSVIESIPEGLRTEMDEVGRFTSELLFVER